MHVNINYGQTRPRTYIKQLGFVNESAQQLELKEIHRTWPLVLKHEIFFYLDGHVRLRWLRVSSQLHPWIELLWLDSS